MDVTTAVLLATAENADAAERYAEAIDGESVIGRLIRQLRAHGISRITVVVSAAAAPLIARMQLGAVDIVATPADRDPDGPCLVAPADLVCHDRVLDMVLSGGARTVVAPPDREGERVRVEYGVVVLDSSSGPGQRTLVGLTVDDGAAPWRAVELRDFVCERVLTPDDVQRVARALASIDEDELWLAAAVKADDSPVATYLVSSWSRYLARWLARRTVAPTTVTVASLALGALAGWGFATGDRPWMSLGAIALLAAFVLDCVDGQIARYTRRFTSFGGWLDAVGDRAKEYGAYAGLAVGWHDSAAWPLAVTALVLQTCRHLADFAYAESRLAHGGGSGGVGGRLDATGRLRWLRRVVILPIGERFLLIAITVVIGGAALTFPVLIAWGLLATAYMVTGRLLRSLAPGGRAESRSSRVLALRDDGPIVRALSRGRQGPPGILPVMNRLDWLAVPVLRLVEYAVIAVLANAADVPWPWIYGCLAALAFHHYDLVYRLRQGRPVPAWRNTLTLGWDGRLLVVVVCAVAGALSLAIPVITVGVAVVVLAESSLTWSGRAPEPAEPAEVAA